MKNWLISDWIIGRCLQKHRFGNMNWFELKEKRFWYGTFLCLILEMRPIIIIATV